MGDPILSFAEVEGFMVAVPWRCSALPAWRLSDGCPTLVEFGPEEPALGQYVRGRMFPFREGWVLGARGGILTFASRR